MNIKIMNRNVFKNVMDKWKLLFTNGVLNLKENP